jgi:hypothetical protein
MVFQAGQRDPCTWCVARLSESVKIHSPAAQVFLRFPKVSRHPSCMDHAILDGKPFGIPLIYTTVYYDPTRHVKSVRQCSTWHILASQQKFKACTFSTSIISKCSVFLCFLSGNVKRMTSTQKKMSSVRYDTVEVENRFKPIWASPQFISGLTVIYRTNISLHWNDLINVRTINSWNSWQ